MEIVELGPKQRIIAPGFYRMPLAQHHSQPCDGISVTSSTLRTMELQTPADVWAFHPLNPDRWEEDDKPALRLGRAMAAYVEGGPEEVEKFFRVLPADKPKRPTPQQIAAYDENRATEVGAKSVEFWRAVEKDPRDILTESEWDMIHNMGKVLARDPAASAALGGEPEVTMAWYDEATDLWCLSRPDQLSFDGLLSDYKKVNTMGMPFNARLVDRRITQHGYDMQMAFAAEGFKALTGEDPSAVGLVFQHDAKPHHVILRSLEAEDIEIGTFRNRRARQTMRDCLNSGHWWGPGEHVGPYIRPEWQRDMLLEQMNTAGVSP